MTIALVSGQTASVTNGGVPSTFNVTLPNNPTPGNFVVACFVNATATTMTAKDSNNNVYTATSKSRFAGTAGAVGIFYLTNAPANATKTIAVTQTVSGGEGFAAEFSGVATSSPFENDATANSGANNTAIATPTYTSTGDGDLYIAACVAGAAITTANSPWTGIGIVENGNFAEYFIQTTHGARAVNYTQSPSSSWSGIVAAFKAASDAKRLIITRQSIIRAAYW